MVREIRINIKGMIRWVLKKWMFVLPAIVAVAVFICFSMCTQETKEYEAKIKYLYTAEELKELLSEEDYAAVERVIATDDLLKKKNLELEELRNQAPTEENLIRQTELLSDINDISQLRVNFVTFFSDNQSRYYWMQTGTTVPMREDIPKPSGLSGHILAYGILGGVVFVVAATIIIYLLLGYLHSKDELEINFGYDVYDVSLKDKELLDKVRFIVRADGLQGAENLVVAGSLNWDKEVNSAIRSAILEETKACFINQIVENVDCYEQLNEKQILLVEKADESKLRKIQDNDLTIRKAKGHVLGVIFLA